MSNNTTYTASAIAAFRAAGLATSLIGNEPPISFTFKSEGDVHPPIGPVQRRLHLSLRYAGADQNYDASCVMVNSTPGIDDSGWKPLDVKMPTPGLSEMEFDFSKGCLIDGVGLVEEVVLLEVFCRRMICETLSFLSDVMSPERAFDAVRHDFSGKYQLSALDTECDPLRLYCRPARENIIKSIVMEVARGAVPTTRKLIVVTHKSGEFELVRDPGGMWKLK